MKLITAAHGIRYATKLNKMNFKNWDLLRIIRLVLALLIAVESFYAKSYWLLIPAAILLIQAIFNMGCLLNSCSIPNHSKNDDKTIQYEEVGK